jgi:hypothetical protein
LRSDLTRCVARLSETPASTAGAGVTPADVARQSVAGDPVRRRRRADKILRTLLNPMMTRP